MSKIQKRGVKLMVGCESGSCSQIFSFFYYDGSPHLISATFHYLANALAGVNNCGRSSSVTEQKILDELLSDIIDHT